MNDRIDVATLIGQLDQIYDAMLAAERRHQHLIDRVQEHYRPNARNLVHYLALRTFDLRDIQWQLSALGLSSLGHSERYSLVNLKNVRYLLRLLSGESPEQAATRSPFNMNYPMSLRQLERHTVALFGPQDFAGHTRVMVTFPTEAATDYDLVYRLMEAGMDVARINCAHDGAGEWRQMVEHVHKAAEELGRKPLIYMDVEGPKIRTGPLPDRTTKKGKKKAGRIKLQVKDRLYLVPESAETCMPGYGPDGELVHPGQISVTLPEMFEDVEAGQRIWFDDGKIGGVVEAVRPDRIVLKIDRAEPGGSNLRAEKGINLPDTQLRLPALTPEDISNLEVIAAEADMVGYSFVRRPSDIEQMQEQLRKLGREDLGIILKIETQEAFENLPILLLTAMRSPRVGIMIARGDLAVELGFRRIAEVQEEILWICEAAYLPVIWATQILENLAKTGLATRAEVSDAVLSVRAECAMLNKGPYIVDAVRTLKDIDRRMAPHQIKKENALRPLSIATAFIER